MVINCQGFVLPSLMHFIMWYEDRFIISRQSVHHCLNVWREKWWVCVCELSGCLRNISTFHHSQLGGVLCRVHTARFSNSSDRRCFHTAWLSGVGFSRCCFHIARWIRDRGFHIARFHNRKNRRQLCLIRKYSQTHARSDKEITQDHADIMVYKSSRNTQ